MTESDEASTAVPSGDVPLIAPVEEADTTRGPTQTLVIERIERVPEEGEPEVLKFRPGVNLIVGPPNAGKSKWVKFIDFLLGDTDTAEDTLGPELAAKYKSAQLTIRICPLSSPTHSAPRHASGHNKPDAPLEARQTDPTTVADFHAAGGSAEDSSQVVSGADAAKALAPKNLDAGEEKGVWPDGRVIVLQRRWKESGAKHKIFVDGVGMPADAVGAMLLELLNISEVHFPKGNPYAPRAWPVLSWRILFRHIYREERFWSDLADRQPDVEQHAALMQFLGLAEALFSVESGALVDRNRRVFALQAEKQSYMAMLHRVTNELGRFEELSVAVTSDSVETVRTRLNTEREGVAERRMALLEALASAVSDTEETGQHERRREIDQRGAELVEVRSRAQGIREELARGKVRIEELSIHQRLVRTERERLARAKVAGTALADLRVTHCPACDQTVSPSRGSTHECHLCLQPYERDEVATPAGSRRLDFESGQLEAEDLELAEILAGYAHTQGDLLEQLGEAEGGIRTLETQLRPIQVAAAAVLPPDLTLLDQQAGSLDEQLRTIESIERVLKQRDALTAQIDTITAEAEKLEAEVQTKMGEIQYTAAAAYLEDGFNSYFNALNVDDPTRWREGEVAVRFRNRDFWIQVKGADWQRKLGATLQCFFLNAYHYALLSLTGQPGCHYPGFAMLDFPPTLADQKVLTHEENYLIEPFIPMLARRAPGKAQLIVAGRAFEHLAGAHRIALETVWE